MKETPEQRQKARACKCVTACRWRGLASKPDWHAGGVQLSGNAAIFLLQPSDKQVPLNHMLFLQMMQGCNINSTGKGELS